MTLNILSIYSSSNEFALRPSVLSLITAARITSESFVNFNEFCSHPHEFELSPVFYTEYNIYQGLYNLFIFSSMRFSFLSDRSSKLE